MTSFIKSPLNYVGGKTKILDQLIPLFPDAPSMFVEPFCGGFNVGINYNGKKNIEIDTNLYLIELFNYFKNNLPSTILASIDKTISKYGLSLTNSVGYNKLRSDYNLQKSPLLLFVLTCFSFNHQIRYNNSFEFNTPFGKNRSSFNNSIKRNLISFLTKIHNIDVDFIGGDFRSFDYSILDSNSFVYCDPPYLITTGSYNDGKRGFGDWKKEDENDLLSLLDNLNERAIKFALSNVFVHMGRENTALIKWAEKYNVHFIKCNYDNSNYHSDAKEHETIEVLITNY